MRLGVIAAVVFMVLSFGLLYGSVENRSLIDEDVQESLNTMQSATKVIEEGDWGNYITLLAAPFVYFDSIVTIAWKAFNNPLWDTGNWILVPYFTTSPLIIVLFFGLIILLVGILRKSF
ncbi:hypothetical protein LCGC14_1378910 [marine sediment metagenome]|uniref:Uncharacterized protein n=1 Tax=marine sediment metagenome TaxID=412755 RepID=A0A0F9N4X1_9ZZZZ